MTTNTPSEPGLYFATQPSRIDILGEIPEKRLPVVVVEWANGKLKAQTHGVFAYFELTDFTDWSGPLADPREETHGSDDTSPR